MIIAAIYPCPFDVQDRHDLSAAIIKDGEIYAYEEDKLSGIKREPTVKFPERSLLLGCKEFGVPPSSIDQWVLPTPSKPVDLKEQYLFFSWLFKAYKGTWDDFAGWYKDHVCFVDHQLSHAALAVFGSKFSECAFVCQDGGGDFGDPRDLIVGEYRDGTFRIIKEHTGLKTICSFHAFITDALSFSGGDNGKTSGLAAYGRVQEDLARRYFELISVEDDGIVFQRERYRNTEVNLGKVRPSEYDRGKIMCRYPSDTNILRMSLEYLPQDIAATGEYVLQVTFLKFLEKIRGMTGMRHIVFSGGLFQNVALNNKILESGLFEGMYIPMAPSDAGLSLGQALYVEDRLSKRERTETMSPYIGPSFDEQEALALLNRFRLNYDREEDISKKAAQLIASGKIVGWFQGKGEYGPRSLGNRSILADPRDMRSKTRVNQMLKRRDWFMPYAPSILEECLHEWVRIPHESPYMQIAFRIMDGKRDLIPAAVHVDDSARLHVLKRSANEKYWRLIDEFRKITGVPLVLNTSFNRHGISTISTQRQAIEHFLEGCMDYLAIGDYLLDFTKNRIVSEQVFPEREEEILLKEDCVKRLREVADHGDGDQISRYVSKLSGLIGIKLDFSDQGIQMDDGGYLRPEEAVAKILERIRTPVHV